MPLMKPELTAFKERWVFLSDLSLEQICCKVQAEFGLPPFAFDSEVDTRWGLSARGGVQIDVTHWLASRENRFEELLHGYPDHNFLIDAFVGKEVLNSNPAHWFLDSTISVMSQRVARAVGTEVHYLTSDPNKKAASFVVYGPEGAE
jgi:hypothetical protein